MKPARTYEQLEREHADALKTLDKVNTINGAILMAINQKGSMTLDEYNQLYAQAVQQWQQKHSTPNN